MSLGLALISLLFRLQDRLGFDGHEPDPGPPPPPPPVAGETRGYMEASDGTKLAYRAWLPPSPVRFTVGCVHGLAAHGAHFYVAGQSLIPLGGATWAIDLRGHGLSEGRRGDLSDMPRILADLADFVCFLKDRHPGLPLFLWGESAGAPIVVKFAVCRQPSLAGLVLSSPQLRSTVPVAPWEIIQNLPTVLFRPWSRALDTTKRLHLSNRRRIDVERERADPLRSNWISARSLVSVYQVIEEVEDMAGRICLPVLLLQGGHDLVTDPRAARRFFRALCTPSHKKRLVMFPNAWHGLLHDPDTPQVLAAATRWLAEQVSLAN